MSIEMKPVVLRTYFYASAIAHSAFRDQSWRRRPRPNENCPLANSMRQFDASNCDGRVRERFEPSHRRTASLDRPMILLNDVVEMLGGDVLSLQKVTLSR